jgi:hypothetical protein
VANTDPISNTEDMLDSRDIEARIEYLSSMDDDDFDVEDADELAHLLSLRDEAQHSGDWQYGATLIHDNYFKTYAEQLADDIGAVNSEASWPLTHIDWSAAAEDLKQDYFSVDFDGQTYWIR